MIFEVVADPRGNERYVLPIQLSGIEQRKALVQLMKANTRVVWVSSTFSGNASIVAAPEVPTSTTQARKQLVTLYREKRPPEWAVRQHVRGQQIPEPGEPAQLTDLGRKLVELTPW